MSSPQCQTKVRFPGNISRPLILDADDSKDPPDQSGSSRIFASAGQQVMRTDTLVHEVHHILSEKGEMEAMPGRSCDETPVVDPPSFHKLALLALAALRRQFLRYG